MTKLVVHRVQQPVGQGFFHTGLLKLDRYNICNSDNAFHYFYDCGSQPKYSGSLNAAIDSYVKPLKPSENIDLGIISHLHQDHVNGLPKLAKSTKIKTIVLPYLDDLERLIIFAKTASDELSLDAPLIDEFYIKLINDPDEALDELGVEEVLYVRASEEPPKPYREGNHKNPRRMDHSMRKYQ